MSPATKPSRAVARPAAVLWDMDGTIVDTEPYWIECEYALVAEFGGEWDDEKAHSLVGHDLRDSAAIIRDRGGVPLPIDDIVNRLLDGVIERVQRKVPWRPGARERLADLRKAGVPCGLVTMSWKRFADAVVKALPPGSFDVVITGDEVSRGKPHPEPYLAAADALGVRAKDCVAIEDSPTGVRSAVAAGCRTFAVPNVVDIEPGRGYTVVRSLFELDDAALGLSARRRTTRAHRRRRTAAGLLAVGVLGAGVVYAVRAGSTPPPYDDIPISAWAPYWVLPEAVASVTQHGSTLHELSPFWYSATGTTTIQFDADSSDARPQQLITAAREQGAKVLPSIVDGMPAGGMAAVLADPATRTQHVNTIVELVRQGGFDGIDIDYEQFAFADDRGTWATTRPNWVAFIEELATVLHADGLLLTVSIPPIYDGDRTSESGYWVYDYAAIGEHVDRIRIMGYDYSVGEAGPIAPIDWVRGAVRAAKDAVDDDDKLVLGVPLYGRNWVVATTGTCPESAEGTTAVTQATVADLVDKRGATPVHDPGTAEASFEYQLDVSDGGVTCTQTRQVHYVDETGARARVDLAREERIGGVAFWALGFDSGATWDAVSDVARPRPTDTVLVDDTTAATG